MASPFCAWETVDTLIQRQRQNKVATNRAKDLIVKLQHLVIYFSEDSNRIDLQLRHHFQSMMPYSSSYLQNHLLLPSDSNSGITESTYFPHMPSPVDLFTHCDSFLESSNFNHNCDTRNNMGFVNGQAWNQQGLVYPGMAESSCSSAPFQNAVDGNILPENGKLLHSVMDVGSLPMWHQPPPQGQQHINYASPPLTIEDLDMVDMGTCADLQENPFPDSMLNFAGIRSDPWIEDQVSGSKRQRLY